MNRRSLAFAISLLTASAALSAQQWVTFKGPTGEEWSRLGTDGSNLYMTTGGNQLWMYSWPQGLPNLGAWIRLPDCPRTIDGWDSYRGLTYQNGYLYTSALAAPPVPYRTVVRFEIATQTWEIWGNPTGTGADLNLCWTSGNGIFMDPALTGVGYSVQHGGNHWVSFDWNAQTADNNWMSTSSLPGADPHWVSRNDDFADDGAGNYYSMKNDWTAGLSSGDILYTFQLGTPPGFVAQKPWEAGCGQTLEYIAATHPLNQTGNDELWLFRGGDCASSPHEGWSAAGTQDLGIYDLTNAAWTQTFVPLFLGHGTDSVKIGDYVFVKACGDATSPTAYNDDFMVSIEGATFTRYGAGCPGTGGLDPIIHAPMGAPSLGNLTFQISLIGAPANAPAILATGFSDQLYQSLPLPLDLTPYRVGGCFLNTSVEATFFLLVDPGGTGLVPVPIPNVPALANFTFFSQWFVIDGGAPNLRRISATQGSRVFVY